MKGDSKMSKKKNTPTETEKEKEEATAAVNNAEPAEETASEAVPKDPAQQALEEATAKANEYLALAQRVQADFENYRRRNESTRPDASADGRKDTASLMLPVLDNL